jgi:hypothetical protein
MVQTVGLRPSGTPGLVQTVGLRPSGTPGSGAGPRSRQVAAGWPHVPHATWQTQIFQSVPTHYHDFQLLPE